MNEYGECETGGCTPGLLQGLEAWNLGSKGMPGLGGKSSPGSQSDGGPIQCPAGQAPACLLPGSQLTLSTCPSHRLLPPSLLPHSFQGHQAILESVNEQTLGTILGGSLWISVWRSGYHQLPSGKRGRPRGTISRPSALTD